MSKKDKKAQVMEYLANNMDIDLEELFGPDFDVDEYIDVNWAEIQQRMEGKRVNRLPDWMEDENE